MNAALVPPAMPPAMPVMELEAVTKIYAGSPPVTALAGVSFTVTAGEMVAVVGPSGSGKTTLLHLMGTLDRPASGVVRVTGLDVAGLSAGALPAGGPSSRRPGGALSAGGLADSVRAYREVA